MKIGFVSLVLGAILCLSVFWVAGCGYVVKVGEFLDQKAADVATLGSTPEFYSQMGETEAEGQRRHARNQRLNRQALMEDIDAFLLLDKPSRMTERTIP